MSHLSIFFWTGTSFFCRFSLSFLIRIKYCVILTSLRNIFFFLKLIIWFLDNFHAEKRVKQAASANKTGNFHKEKQYIKEYK